jgi:hypothetical protein
VTPTAGELGWCRLRQLPIHADLIGDLWCHHWTARPPRLPDVPPAPPVLAAGNRQLSLAPMLQEV